MEGGAARRKRSGFGSSGGRWRRKRW